MICVIGAAAVDAVARRERFRRGTSNPAEIRLAAGGVGCRIFRRLPQPRMLITAVGDDALGLWLRQRLLQEPGAVPLSVAGARSACYLALMQSGRLLYGAADMTVIEQGLDWALVAPQLPELGPDDLLVLEANLAPGLVYRLLQRLGRRTRVVFESVSVEKLRRHAPGLADLFLLSGNEEEIRGLGPEDGGRGEGWVEGFLEKRRVENLLVTRGQRGVRLHRRGAPGEALSFAPGRRVAPPDSTGAGDRLLSGVLGGLAAGRPLPGAVTEAMRCVERALEEDEL